MHSVCNMYLVNSIFYIIIRIYVQSTMNNKTHLSSHAAQSERKREKKNLDMENTLINIQCQFKKVTIEIKKLPHNVSIV